MNFICGDKQTNRQTKKLFFTICCQLEATRAEWQLNFTVLFAVNTPLFENLGLSKVFTAFPEKLDFWFKVISHIRKFYIWWKRAEYYFTCTIVFKLFKQPKQGKIKVKLGTDRYRLISTKKNSSTRYSACWLWLCKDVVGPHMENLPTMLNTH